VTWSVLLLASLFAPIPVGGGHGPGDDEARPCERSSTRLTPPSTDGAVPQKQEVAGR
jgi:hypothetical protein